VFRSTDGGTTWKHVLAVSPEVGAFDLVLDPNNPRILYASTWRVKRTPSSFESGGPGSGIWKSTDGGDTWKELTRHQGLPKGNVGLWRSRDGGKTFQPLATPHGDHHDLWINPQEPERMIVADDGGAQVTANGGKSWTTYHNQPTAQFYRVTTDNHFPYRIYGAQ